MAFVASSVAAVSGPLPQAVDVGSSAPAFTLYSHMRVAGAGTVTFDTGQVFTSLASTDNVFAIPPGARSMVIAGGTPTVQYGQSL